MGHRESGDGKIFGFEKRPRLDFPEVKRHGGRVAAQHHILDQGADAIQCGAPSKDFELVNRLPAHERAEQTAEAENMIQVTVREQDARQMPKANPRLQDLALSPFAAIDQKTIFVVCDDLS